MDLMHMLPEDEIFLCGLALFVGILLGIGTGLLRSRRSWRTA